MKLKKADRLTVFLGLACLVWSQGVGIANTEKGKNRLPNPSFEKDFEGWNTSASDDGIKVGIDNTVGHTGKNSVFVKKTARGVITSIITERVDVVPGETYVVSGYIKTDLEEGKAYITLDFLSNSGKRTGSYEDDVKLTGANDWTHLGMSRVAPPDSDYAEMRFQVIHFTGTIWCDDAEVTGKQPGPEDKVDTNPPYLGSGYPPEGSTISWRKPVISAYYADADMQWYPRLVEPDDSGVDLGTVVMILDGKDITQRAQVEPFAASYIPAAPLSEGSHTVSVRARDKAGNLAETKWAFEIDTSKPLPKRGEENHNIWSEGKGIKEFYFVHLSDSQLDGRPEHDGYSDKVVDIINKFSPPPAFVVMTGDIIDDGYMAGYPAATKFKEAFEKYVKIFSKLSPPFFTVIGNHDLPRRWFLKEYLHYSPEKIHSILEVDGEELAGKEMFAHYIGAFNYKRFEKHFSPLRYSFDYGGWHFIVYDPQQEESFNGVNTTRSFGCVSYAWVSPEIMLWIEEDLRIQREGQPAIILVHQNMTPHDKYHETYNKEGLLRILTQFNVRAGFCGHGGVFQEWEIAGIRMTMGADVGGTPHGRAGYVTVQIKGGQVNPQVHWLEPPR